MGRTSLPLRLRVSTKTSDGKSIDHSISDPDFQATELLNTKVDIISKSECGK